MKALIVEDDFTSRMLLQKLLAGYGEAHVATNGKEAVDAFELAVDGEEPYDLICLDIMMPELDGHGVLKAVRRMEAERGLHGLDGVKIVMTTALKDSKNVLGAFSEQCDGYLTKPIEKPKLVAYLEEFGLLG